MSTLIEKTDTVKKYVSLFEDHQHEIFGNEPSAMTDLRKEAITAFERLGFPRKKAENYKYVHLEPFFNDMLETRF